MTTFMKRIKHNTMFYVRSNEWIFVEMTIIIELNSLAILVINRANTNKRLLLVKSARLKLKDLTE